MILDSLLQLADAQAVTASAISENVIDLASVVDNPTRDIGTGEDLYLVVATQTAATAAGAATLTVTLESDDNVGLTSATTHFSSGVLALAAFQDAGSQLAVVKLPAGAYQQYLGLRFTIATGPLTAGNFDAFLTKDVDVYTAYANRTTITG